MGLAPYQQRERRDVVEQGQRQAPAPRRAAARARRRSAERRATAARRRWTLCAATIVNGGKALTATPMKKNEPPHISENTSSNPHSVAVIARCALGSSQLSRLLRFRLGLYRRRRRSSARFRRRRSFGLSGDEGLPFRLHQRRDLGVVSALWRETRQNCVLVVRLGVDDPRRFGVAARVVGAQQEVEQRVASSTWERRGEWRRSPSPTRRLLSAARSGCRRRRRLRGCVLWPLPLRLRRRR